MKLLLLGTGEAGKSTILKQLARVTGDPYESDGQEKYICLNILKGTDAVLKEMPETVELDEITAFLLEDTRRMLRAKEEELLQWPLRKSEGYIAEMRSSKDKNKTSISRELFTRLRIVWQMDEFRETLKKIKGHGKHGIPTNYEELMQNLVHKYPEWGGKGWAPTEKDSLLASVRSTGFTEQKLHYNDRTITVFDVSGSRSERRKWRALSSATDAVLFVIAANEFDQTIWEDNITNSLHEAITLFQSVCESEIYDKTPIFLVLNKIDLFEKKFLNDKIPINVSGHFPNAPTKNETAQDLKRGLDFIETSCFTGMPEAIRGRIEVFRTDALQVDNVEQVLKRVLPQVKSKPKPIVHRKHGSFGGMLVPKALNRRLSSPLLGLLKRH